MARYAWYCRLIGLVAYFMPLLGYLRQVGLPRSFPGHPELGGSSSRFGVFLVLLFIEDSKTVRSESMHI
jgi:hypothetical protein